MAHSTRSPYFLQQSRWFFKGPIAHARSLGYAGLFVPCWLLPVMATWYIRSQNCQLRLPNQYFSLPRTRLREKGERVHLTDSERKSPSVEKNRCFLAQCAQESYADTRLEVFQGIFTNDDNILAHLDSLLYCRLSFTLFRQPFGSY